MRNSKSLAVIFLLGAFFAGGALGFTVEHMLDREKPGLHEGKKSMSSRIAKELDLTPAQRASMDSLMTRRREQIREIYRPIRPQLDSLDRIGRAMSDSTHAQIRRILDSGQQVKWDAIRSQARKAYEASRRRNNERR